jgi:hypothetical protein
MRHLFVLNVLTFISARTGLKHVLVQEAVLTRSLKRTKHIELALKNKIFDTASETHPGFRSQQPAKGGAPSSQI